MKTIKFVVESIRRDRSTGCVVVGFETPSWLHSFGDPKPTTGHIDVWYNNIEDVPCEVGEYVDVSISLTNK